MMMSDTLICCGLNVKIREKRKDIDIYTHRECYLLTLVCGKKDFTVRVSLDCILDVSDRTVLHLRGIISSDGKILDLVSYVGADVILSYNDDFYYFCKMRLKDAFYYQN